MIRRKFIMAAASMAILAGCAGTWSTNYTGLTEAQTKGWKVGKVTVNVPASLTVNDADSLSPDGDIVWRGEPAGDRRAQVRAIFEDGIKRGTRSMRGRTSVNLIVDVKQFHAMSERARAKLQNSGVHNITFDVTVTDRSGKILVQEPGVKADLVAFSGSQAAQAEAQGLTQRVRIVNHLGNVFAHWFGGSRDVRQSFQRNGR